MSASRLDADQEKELWYRYKQHNDQAARSRIIENYLPLVYKIAWQTSRSLKVSDLAHEGVIGLIEAVEHFDPLRSVQFQTYAYSRIYGAIIDALRRDSPGTRSIFDRRLVRQKEDELACCLGRKPSEKELADALSIAPDRLRRWQYKESCRPVFSLDAALFGGRNGSPLCLRDLVPDRQLNPGDQIESEVRLAMLLQSIDQLPEQEKATFQAHLEGILLKDIGAQFGVTESYISKTLKKVKKELLLKLQYNSTSKKKEAVMPEEKPPHPKIDAQKLAQARQLFVQQGVDAYKAVARLVGRNMADEMLADLYREVIAILLPGLHLRGDEDLHRLEIKVRRFVAPRRPQKRAAR